MKKNFKSYAVIWSILLVAFNAVVFLMRPIIPGYEVIYDIRFWIAWVFILVAFAANLLCANMAFKAANLEKMFYKVSLITVSYTGLIAMLVFGSALMLIPNCPAWIAAIVCIAVAAFTAMTVVKANWAGETAGAIDERVKTQTQFIKLLTADAEGLASRAAAPEAKAACKKVYEALRYSDPMSNDELEEIENRIKLKFDEFSNAVVNETDNACNIADELVILVGDRNRKCKLLK